MSAFIAAGHSVFAELARVTGTLFLKGAGMDSVDPALFADRIVQD
jgi:hypothetical protein